MDLPEAIKRLASELADLPSIGPRQATRMAFHLAHRDRSRTEALAASLAGLSGLKICDRCFFLHDNQSNACAVCSSNDRSEKLVMIVEKETDLLSLEKIGRFRGRYLVLGQMPRSGTLTTEQKRRLHVLANSLKELPDGKAEEVILAFNPTSLGDFHASLVIKEISPYTAKTSRLGRGLPSGGEIEFADDETLGSALERRN